MRDRYRVMKTLGKGGFGATFLAFDLSLPGQPSCVIKQLRPSSKDPDIFEMAKELFEREAQTLGKIGNHPQIPRLLDYFEDNQQFYLVQEYVSGHNLQREIKRNGTYSEVAAKQFLSEVLPIIKYIHSQKVIHRDIKPANIIRREQDSRLVLIDFGAVKNQVTSTTIASNNPETALTAFAVGTAGFAPPEQMAMRPVYASDIYAVGATCIYLLTGKSPKDLDVNPSTGEILWHKYVSLSENFARVLTKMLEASVYQRYKSADEALEALALEPYFDTLSQGLSGQTSLSNNLSNNNLSNNLASSQFWESATPESPTISERAKLATAIRNRNKRKNLRLGNNVALGEKKESPSNYARATQISKTPINRYSKVAKKSQAKKLDADTLVTQYSSGRRNFAQQDLNQLNLGKVNLSGINFHQSKLMKVNFGGANLSGADFGKANLNRAVLRNADLSRAYLSYTNLGDADLRGADLSFAYLNHANLRGANLCGANLSNAKIDPNQLAQAKTNWATIMPSGKRAFW